eukprot:jgi/Hompol1/6065/HPOL_004860-RA
MSTMEILPPRAKTLRIAGPGDTSIDAAKSKEAELKEIMKKRKTTIQKKAKEVAAANIAREQLNDRRVIGLVDAYYVSASTGTLVEVPVRRAPSQCLHIVGSTPPSTRRKQSQRGPSDSVARRDSVLAKLQTEAKRRISSTSQADAPSITTIADRSQSSPHYHRHRKHGSIDVQRVNTSGLADIIHAAHPEDPEDQFSPISDPNLDVWSVTSVEGRNNGASGSGTSPTPKPDGTRDTSFVSFELVLSEPNFDNTNEDLDEISPSPSSISAAVANGTEMGEISDNDSTEGNTRGKQPPVKSDTMKVLEKLDSLLKDDDTDVVAGDSSLDERSARKFKVH